MKKKFLFFLYICCFLFLFIGCTKKEIKETKPRSISPSEIEEVYLYSENEYSLDEDIFLPQLLFSEDKFHFDLTDSEYLEGKFNINEDGLMILKTEINETKLKDTIVNTISFKQIDKKLILQKELKNYLNKDSVFE